MNPNFIQILLFMLYLYFFSIFFFLLALYFLSYDQSQYLPLKGLNFFVFFCFCFIFVFLNLLNFRINKISSILFKNCKIYGLNALTSFFHCQVGCWNWNCWSIFQDQVRHHVFPCWTSFLSSKEWTVQFML